MSAVKTETTETQVIDPEAEALRTIADLPAEARKWLISAEPDEGDRFDAELPGVLDHSISNMRGNGLSVVALARAACYLARSMAGEAADLPDPEPKPSAGPDLTPAEASTLNEQAREVSAGIVSAYLKTKGVVLALKQACEADLEGGGPDIQDAIIEPVREIVENLATNLQELVEQAGRVSGALACAMVK